MQPFTFFLSYRRQDTAPIALLLKSEIEKRLQFVRVAVDVEEMAPGDQFPNRLKLLIDGAHATIALIGKHWMPQRGSNEDRIGDDWVARELEYSASAPITQAEADRYGLSHRVIIPLFADCDRSFDQFELPDAIAYLSKHHSEHIDYASWPSAIGPLLDRIAVKLNLKKRPDAEEYSTQSQTWQRQGPSTWPTRNSPQFLAMTIMKVGMSITSVTLKARYLVKTFKFGHFNQAADFMELVANHCRVLDHHPEWRNVFNHVTVALTTWDARRKVTIYDLSLALYMNMAAKSVAKKQ